MLLKSSQIDDLKIREPPFDITNIDDEIFVRLQETLFNIKAATSITKIDGERSQELSKKKKKHDDLIYEINTKYFLPRCSRCLSLQNLSVVKGKPSMGSVSKLIISSIESL
jgi:hypothetical protein